MSFNYIDVAVLCLLLYGMGRGASRGFFVEVSSLLALILGVFGALQFSSFTADVLSKYFQWEYLSLLAFALTFIGIVIGVAWIGKILTKLAKVVLLGFLNKLLGALFGACKWMVISGVFVWILSGIHEFYPFLPENLSEKSLFFEPLKELGNYLFEQINIPENPIDTIPPIRL